MTNAILYCWKLQRGSVWSAYTVVEGKFACKLDARHKAQHKHVVHLCFQKIPAVAPSLFTAFPWLFSGIIHLLYLLNHKPARKAQLSGSNYLLLMERKTVCVWIKNTLQLEITGTETVKRQREKYSTACSWALQNEEYTLFTGTQGRFPSPPCPLQYGGGLQAGALAAWQGVGNGLGGRGKDTSGLPLLLHTLPCHRNHPGSAQMRAGECLWFQLRGTHTRARAAV